MQLEELIERAEAIAGGTRKLAAVLGVSPAHVSHWKHGNRACPHAQIVAMAKLAGLPPKRTLGDIVWSNLGKLTTTAAAGAVATLLCWPGRADAAPTAGLKTSGHYV